MWAPRTPYAGSAAAGARPSIRSSDASLPREPTGRRTAPAIPHALPQEADRLADADSPGETPEPDGTSLRNRFDGTVTGVESDEEIVGVTLSLAGGATLEALVTRSSLERLALEPGREVVASFEATAARGTTLESTEE